MVAAIYTRQSLDKTGEEAGVKRQLEECREKARDLDVAYELSDNDISATTGKKRPDFEKLLSLIESGEVDTIVCWHTDRLYRKLRDLVRITDLAEKHRLSILTVKSGEIDLNSSTGRMVAGILGSVSSQEGEHRTDRQKSAYADYAKAGVWHFSHRPFGYTRGPKVMGPKNKWIAGKVTVVEEEAKVLREVYDLYYDKGKSHHFIVKMLNDKGVLTAKGNSWTITQLREVLNNPRYAGKCFYNGVEVGMGDWEPIITPTDYERYVGAASKRKTVSTFTREAKSLLSGLIVCGVCGAKVYRMDAGTKVVKSWAYRCREGVHGRVNCTDAEHDVTTALIESLVLGPRGGAVAQAELEQVMTQLADIDDSRVGTLKLLEDRTIKPMDAAPILDKLNADEAVLTAKKNAIVQRNAEVELLAGLQREVFEGNRASFDKAAAVATQIGERFKGMDLARQRELIRYRLKLSLDADGLRIRKLAAVTAGGLLYDD